MTERQNNPTVTLAQVFFLSLMESQVKKPAFGKKYLPLANFLMLGGYIYETGAVLAWAYKDNQLALERVLGQPTTPGKLVDFARSMARERMAECDFKDDSLGLFFYKTEVARYRHSIDMSSLESMKKFSQWIKQQRIGLETANSELQSIFTEGIGYGFEFSEETQRIWKKTHEEPHDPIKWQESYRHGIVTTPEPPPIQTLDERISELKNILIAYITEYQPWLINIFTK